MITTVRRSSSWCLLALVALLALGCSTQEVLGPDVTTVVENPESALSKLTVTTVYNNAQPSTEIAFDLPQAGYVFLEVTNATGYHVATIVDDELEAGSYGVLWDATNDDGEPIESGIYLFHLVSSSYEIWSAAPFNVDVEEVG